MDRLSFATMPDEQRCEFCHRLVPRRMITQHHLTPRQKGGTHVDCVPMCRPCHKMVHATFTNRELAERYATIEELRTSPELAGFRQWIRKQDPGRNFTVRQSNDHPDKSKRRRR